MKICYFGTYENTYPRNAILINGLRKNKIEVIECHAKLWNLEDDKTKIFQLPINYILIPIKIAISYFLLLYKYISTKSYKCDIIIVGYPAHLDVFLAYTISILLRKNLVFNPLISIYDTLVNDRKLIKKNSAIANFILLIERTIFRLPKLVLLDTYAHISLLRRILSIPNRTKMARVFIGAEEKLFRYKPFHKRSPTLNISFIGKFTPLHGLPVIIKAIKILEKYKDIHFTIVGKGQLSETIESLRKRFNLRNVNFISWVPYRQLSQIIHNSDICLGIFDDGEKAKSVIPNKIYESIAIGKTVITEDSPAINELFQDNKNIVLCLPNNPASLAQKILFLYSNPENLKKISQNAHALFEQKLTEEKIGKTVKQILESL